MVDFKVSQGKSEKLGKNETKTVDNQGNSRRVVTVRGSQEEKGLFHTGQEKSGKVREFKEKSRKDPKKPCEIFQIFFPLDQIFDFKPIICYS